MATNNNALNIPITVDGQLIIGSSSTVPAAATLTAGTGISIANASHSITITNTGSGASPAAGTLVLVEDFLGIQIKSVTTPLDFNFIGNLGWITFPTNIFSPVGLSLALDAGHPGIVTQNGDMGIILQTPSATLSNAIDPSMILGGGVLTTNWVIKITTLSTLADRYILTCGLGNEIYNAGVLSDQTDGCYFRYSDNVNSGNWQAKTAKASTRTTISSSTAATTSWVNLGLTVNAAATSVEFFINGASIGTSATNIPTVGISPFVGIHFTSGVGVNAVYVDLMYLQYTLTSSR